MIGAAFVITLVSLAIPIVLLFAALLFDAVVVLWALFRMWHDDWSPRLVGLVTRPFARPHGVLRHRHGAAFAH